MKRNLLPLLGIAFVVALAASGIFYGLFIGQLKQASRGAAPKQLVVASKTLERGTVLKATDLKLSPWAGSPPPGSYQSIEGLPGKTLYTPLEENSPVIETHFSAEKAGGQGIRRGMRALSLRVLDSGGLMPFLHAGSRVDVQVVQARSSINAALRTILQNVEVLSVQAPADPVQAQFAPATVTVLATPQDADKLALADSGGSIRIQLRNTLDDGESSRTTVALLSLFRDSPSDMVPMVNVVRPRPASGRVPTPRQSAERVADPTAPWERVELLIQIAGTGPRAMEELRAVVPLIQPFEAMQVSAFPADAPGGRFLAGLEQKKQIAVLSTSRLSASNKRSAYLRSGRQWISAPGGACGLSIRFQPSIEGNGLLRLQIEPSLTIPSGRSGVSTRRVVTDISLRDGQSVVVTGLAEPSQATSLAEQLFGDMAKRVSNADLMVVVTPHLPAQRGAIAMTPR